MAKKYIIFKRFRNLEVWNVLGKRDKNTLEIIEKYNKWDRLTFEANENIVWTSECLHQIVDFLKEQENG